MHTTPENARAPGSTWRRIAPVLLIAGVVLAAFARLVAQPGGLIVDGDRAAFQQHERPRDATPGNDLTRLFLPQHLRVTRAVTASGRIPFWDSAGFGGRPLIGNPQAGLWYPPVWPFWAFPFPALLGWITVGHLIWAGLGTWWLGRDVGLERAAALVSAGAFAIGPYLLGHVAAGHVPHVWAVSWYPWAFLAARRARAGSWRGAAGLAAAWSFCLFAGHPQEAILLGLALGAWWLVDLARRHVKLKDMKPFESLRPPIVLAVLVLTASITALEWLPVASIASWERDAGRRLSWGELGECRVRVENLLQLASPRAIGSASDYFGRDNQWEACLSFGFIALVLAVLGATASVRRRETRGWLALLVGSLWFAAGPSLGFFAVCATLFPPLASLRAPGRALFLTALAVAVLSGMGVEALSRGIARASVWKLRRGLAIVTALVLIGGLAALALGPGLDSPPGRDARGWALSHSTTTIVLLGCRRLICDPLVICTLITLLGALICLERLNNRRRVASAIAAMAVLELVAWGIVMVPVSPASRFLAPDAVTDTLEEMMPDEGPGHRVLARESIWPNLASARSHLDRTDLYDRFQVRHAAALYEPLYPLLDDPRPREAANPALARQNAALRLALLDRLAVGFIVHDQPNVTLGWPCVAAIHQNSSARWIFAHPDPLPRAYVVPRVEVVPDDDQAVSRFPDVPAREAVLATFDPLADHEGPRQPFSPARIVRLAPDRLRVEVTTQAPGLLVLAETGMPGWTARDGSGNPLLIHRGNGAQMFVALARPGPHAISLSYRAPGLRPAAVLTVLGLVAVCVLAAPKCLGQTHPIRLRRIHSALKSAANRSRNGQLSQSRTSR